jgi:Protein of unknown function (DUF3551)
MRNIVLALLAASGLAVVGAAPAAAVGTQYPFCMQGRTVPGLSDCSYASYEQCAATASGRLLYCIDNPYFDPGLRYHPSRHRGPHVRPVHPVY